MFIFLYLPAVCRLQVFVRKQESLFVTRRLRRLFCLFVEYQCSHNVLLLYCSAPFSSYTSDLSLFLSVFIICIVNLCVPVCLTLSLSLFALLIVCLFQPFSLPVDVEQRWSPTASAFVSEGHPEIDWFEACQHQCPSAASATCNAEVSCHTTPQLPSFARFPG